MLPDIKDASSQILVTKMLGTTKSQLCPFLLSADRFLVARPTSRSASSCKKCFEEIIA